jgi:hypothetical protein
MKIDHCYRIGSTHDVCQDFASSAQNAEGESFVIVADGCSASSDSAVGAMVLSNIFLNKFKKGMPLVPFRCADDAGEIITKHLGLSIDSLYTTALFVSHTGNEIWCRGFGDGCFAFMTIDNEMVIINISYNDYPFYLNYTLAENSAFEKWKEQSKGPNVSVTKLDKYGIISAQTVVDRIEGIPGTGIVIQHDPFGVDILVDDNVIQWVAAMSDGISSFAKTKKTKTSIESEKLPYADVIWDLFNLKNINGKFMQRRLNRFLKECNNEGIYHTDDISFGVIINEHNFKK